MFKRKRKVYLVQTSDVEHCPQTVATVEFIKWFGVVTAKVYEHGKLIHQNWSFGSVIRALKGAKIDQWIMAGEKEESWETGYGITRVYRAIEYDGGEMKEETEYTIHHLYNEFGVEFVGTTSYGWPKECYIIPGLKRLEALGYVLTEI